MANYRLNESMESRIHREVYVRFGGELSKSRHSNMKMGVGSLAYVINTVGNIFSGQVVGETSKTLSERFGKVLQKRQSISINRQDVSTSINTQMDSLIPPSKISRLTETPHHQRFLGCGWQRLYGADHTGQLQPNQGGCQADSQG